jgi:ApaG protein
MQRPIRDTIEIQIRTSYLDAQSAPGQGRYVFSYTVRLANRGKHMAQLLDRHWIITDANGKVEEVRGRGVIGEQPRLQPGEVFEYTSGAVLATDVGTMQGAYTWLDDDGEHFQSPVPRFTLSIPRTLH